MPHVAVVDDVVTPILNRIASHIRSFNRQLSAYISIGYIGDQTSDRLSDFMRSCDVRGERAIAAAQGFIAIFVLLLHLGARVGKDLSAVNLSVVSALIALLLSSLLRTILSRQENFPERRLIALNVADVSIFLLLIWSYQFAYDHPAGGVLQAPSLSILFVLVALRALRSHPIPLVTTGLAAVVGWAMLLVAAVVADGAAGVTHDYNVYLTTSMILVGAEIEKLAALTMLVAFLAFAAHRARETLVQMDTTLEQMPQGVAMFDPSDKLVICNKLFAKLYGFKRHDVQPGAKFRELVSSCQERKFFGAENDGEEFTSEWSKNFTNAAATVQELADGRVFSIRRRRTPELGTITSTEDITDRRLLETRIEHMAYHDALTGLANRMQLLERLEVILAGNRNADSVAAFCLDLDRFKEVNDTLGHHIGDTLLKAVADRLRASVRDTDIVARTGGDEFVVVQASVASSEEVSLVASRIIDALSAPYELQGHSVMVGVSVGISIPEDRNITPEDLIKQADLALYRAKEDGRGVFRYFEEDMNKRMMARRRMESELRAAFSANQFELYYQPVFSADQSHINGVEALIRWNHPQKGTVSPGEFIPLIEEIGLATPLGQWVIQKACSDAAEWAPHVKVAVNVSAAQFSKPGLVEIVQHALEATGLAASRLELEITETALMEHTETTLEMLDQLRAMGVNIALDDFGTGYASLSYLQKFPFDRIKIDRSFIDKVAENGSSSEIVRAVISLANGLGMATTAEGVETRQQLERIKDEGCSDIQGFLKGRPMQINQINDLLAKQQKNHEAV